MKIRRAVLIFVAGIVAISCSEKTPPDHTEDASPSAAPREPQRVSTADTAGVKAAPPPVSEGKIGRDCAAFVRATKVGPAQPARADCPGCPAEGAGDVLTLRQMKTDAVSCSGDMCNVVVTVRAVFNPAAGETIAGGLTAWIPPEQRSAYLSGSVPTEEQVYRVQITYRHRGGQWRAIEYDRAPAE